MIELPRPEDVDLVRVDDISTYLAAKGWQQQSGSMRNADLWIRPDTPRSRDWRGTIDDLILPRAAESLDYSRRLMEAIGVLCAIEGRPSAAVLRDILTSRADVVRLKRPSDSAEGSIPLSDGVLLVDSALEVMTAAACSAVTPRRVLPSRRPLNAEAYLRRVRLGQTEKSSYVITVISPVEPLESEEPSLFEATDDTYPRRVTKTLATGLAALEYGATEMRRSGDFRVFEDLVSQGVSANLCEAVSRLLRSPGPAEVLSINIDWALSRPAPDVAGQVTFEPDLEPYLVEAANHFRETEPLESILVTGVVVRLQRRREELEGRITVSCVVDGDLRQLWVPLGLADYQNAVDAHREQRGVMFRANVSREGRHYVASNVREFRVV